MVRILTAKFIVLFSLFLLTSCLTIEANLNIEADESGTARLVYSVSTLAYDLSKIDHDGNVLYFPIMQSDFEAAAIKSGGIQIIEYNMTDDGSRYYIDSEISFDSLQSLSLFSGSEISVVNSGFNKLLTIVVYTVSGDREIGDESLNIVRENFADDFISFSISIPGDIILVNGATFSGSEVFFSMAVEDMLSSTGNVQFSVEYR